MTTTNRHNTSVDVDYGADPAHAESTSYVVQESPRQSHGTRWYTCEAGTFEEFDDAVKHLKYVARYYGDKYAYRVVETVTVSRSVARVA